MTRRGALSLLFAGLLAAFALVVAAIADKPCSQRASECCEDASCREIGESYDECYDREAYFCPFEGSC